MKRTNIRQPKPTKVKKHPLGSSIIDQYLNADTMRMHYTDGYRTFASIRGGKG